MRAAVKTATVEAATTMKAGTAIEAAAPVEAARTSVRATVRLRISDSDTAKKRKCRDTSHCEFSHRRPSYSKASFAPDQATSPGHLGS